PFTVTEGDSSYVVAPAKEFRLTVTIEWPHPLIGRQSGSYTVTPQSFARELAPERTFGFAGEVEEHKATGRHIGTSATSAIVLEGRQRIVVIKNVTINEPFFQGHFPGHPIMPGVLIIEAMAQVGGMLLMSHFEGQDVSDKVVYFMSLDNVKFRRPVVPGDQIRFELEMIQFRGKTCKMKGVGYVDGQVVAEADMMAMVTEK